MRYHKKFPKPLFCFVYYNLSRMHSISELSKTNKSSLQIFFFNYCTFLYVGAKLCSVRRVLASFCFAVLPPCPPPPLYLLLS